MGEFEKKPGGDQGSDKGQQQQGESKPIGEPFDKGEAPSYDKDAPSEKPPA